jgi:hypothetical protein
MRAAFLVRDVAEKLNAVAGENAAVKRAVALAEGHALVSAADWPYERVREETEALRARVRAANILAFEPVQPISP